MSLPVILAERGAPTMRWLPILFVTTMTAVAVAAADPLPDDRDVRCTMLGGTTASLRNMTAQGQLQLVRQLDPFQSKTSAQEIAMIQSTLLLNNTVAPVTPQQALDQFSDRSRAGRNGGLISYYRTSRQATSVYALVTNRIGDNEFGALYMVSIDPREAASVQLLGLVRTGRLICL